MSSIYSDIEALKLFCSSTCNLNCSYCYLHKNEAYRKYDSYIKEEWKSGRYIDTIQKVLDLLGSDPLKVHTVSLWGGETYLHVDILKEQLPRLVKLCPNINLWISSSNGLINIEEFIKMIQAIDAAAKTPYTFNFQFSVDGPDGVLTEKGHCSDKKIIQKNCEILFTFLNNTKLYKLKKFNFSIKPTIATPIFLEYFSNFDNAKKYLTYMYNTYSQLSKAAVNSLISVNMTFPAPTLPCNATSEDGIKFRQCCDIWKRAGFEVYGEQFNQQLNPTFGLQELCSAMPFSDGILNMKGQEFTCGSYLYELPITPDGTIVDCSASYFLYRPECYEEYKHLGQHEDAALSKLYQSIVFNPLTMPKEELDKRIYAAVGTGFAKKFVVNMTLAQMRELAWSGQIPWKYGKDTAENIKIAEGLITYGHCVNANLVSNHNPLIPDSNLIKLICNGVYDKIINEQNEGKV